MPEPPRTDDTHDEDEEDVTDPAPDTTLPAPFSSDEDDDSPLGDTDQHSDA